MALEKPIISLIVLRQGVMSMAFWKCYYHAVWATQGRAPSITLEMERVIFETIRRKSEALDCPILAMSGVSDHIHVAVTIPPKLAAAEWVRNVKGLTAREVNAVFPDLPSHFKWQNSYGILTFGEGYIDTIVKYIEQQKEHHAQNSINEHLERIDEE
jgi:putative transposase